MNMKILNEDRPQFMVLMRSLRHGAVSRGVGNRRFFGKRSSAHLRDGEEGNALVEFALVAPLMLLLMTGMFSVVMALMNYQQLGNAVNTASQQVMAARSNGSDPCAAVVSTVTTVLPSWTASKFTYTVQIYTTATASTTYGPTTGSSFSCTAGEANLTPGYSSRDNSQLCVHLASSDVVQMGFCAKSVGQSKGIGSDNSRLKGEMVK